MKRSLVLGMVGCALVLGGQHAEATSALTGSATMTELRFAYAETAQWTTVWSSFRIEGGAGPLGVVVPLPEGAFVDLSSDAWFEALEVATAPRVLPPDGLSPFCPGETGSADLFEVTAVTSHKDSLLPQLLTVLPDVTDVSSWAGAQGLTVDGELSQKLAATGAASFLVMRLNAPGSSASTPIVRVTAPSGLAVLPFSITRAGAADVRVTAWLFGEGSSALTGTLAAPVPGNAIAWNAKTGMSNYVEYRDKLLAGDGAKATMESTAHSLFTSAVPVAGNETAGALAQVYFERASAYGSGLPDAAPCVSAVKVALGSQSAVGPVCPRGDLAAPPDDCTDSPPGPGELDPAAFLCGAGADDLALVMATAVPSDTWVTRHTFVIPAGGSGTDRGVYSMSGSELLPIRTAAAVDIADCFGGSGGSGTTSSSGTGASTGGTTTSSTGSGTGGVSSGAGNGAGPTGPGAGGSAGDPGWTETDSSVYIDTSGCACGGPIDTYDSADTYSSGDDCDGGSSSGGGDDCDSGSSAGSSGDDCDSGSSAGSSGDDCDSGSAGSSDGCDGGSAGGDGSDGGSAASSDCSVGRSAPMGRRKLSPKLSVMALMVFGLLLPLRRRGTRRRRASAAG